MKTKQNNKKLLIFTVDNSFSKEIDASLYLKNFEILKAKSHREALALFEKHAAAIVIIDI